MRGQQTMMIINLQRSQLYTTSVIKSKIPYAVHVQYLYLYVT